MAGLILWPFLLNINLLLMKSCEERGKHSNFKSRIFWFVLFLIIVYECVHVLLAMYSNATHKCMYIHVLVLTEHSNLNFFWEFLFPFNMNIHKSMNFFLMNKLSQWMYIYMYYGISLKNISKCTSTIFLLPLNTYTLWTLTDIFEIYKKKIWRKMKSIISHYM